MKVAITGSTGLIGTALTASLQADGHQVVRLVRRPPRATDEIRWDPRAADAGNPVLSGVSACVHLAGAGVGDHRWTAAYKAEIRSSRVLATRALAAGLVAASPRPATFIVASAIGWYGDTGGAPVTEDAPAGKAFLSRVVADWEAAAAPAASAGIRVAHLRSGLVLASGGGVLGQIGAIVGTIFGTNTPRGKMSTGQVIARDVTRSVTNKVVGGAVANLGKSVGGSLGGSVGRALVRGALGGLLRR